MNSSIGKLLSVHTPNNSFHLFVGVQFTDVMAIGELLGIPFEVLFDHGMLGAVEHPLE